MPSFITQASGEIQDQASIDANARARRRAGSLYGRQSTILAGTAAGMPPTAGAKTALGQ